MTSQVPTLPDMHTSVTEDNLLQLLESWDRTASDSVKRQRLSQSLSKSQKLSTSDKELESFFAKLVGEDFLPTPAGAQARPLTAAPPQEQPHGWGHAQKGEDGGDVPTIEDICNDREAMETLVMMLDEMSDRVRDVSPAARETTPAETRRIAQAPVVAQPSHALSGPALMVASGIRHELAAQFTSEMQVQVKQVAKRRRLNLPPAAVDILLDYVRVNDANPYASLAMKEQLAARCGITVDQG